MFDLPDPFGPTTQVIPGSNRREVAEAKDLNPRRVRLFRYTRGLSLPVRSRPRPALVMTCWPARTAGTQPTSLPAHYRDQRRLLAIHFFCAHAPCCGTSTAGALLQFSALRPIPVANTPYPARHVRVPRPP